MGKVTCRVDLLLREQPFDMPNAPLAKRGGGGIDEDAL